MAVAAASEEQQGEKNDPPKPQPQQKLSKAQERKLKQVQRKQALKDQTSVLYAQLEKTALPANAATLLQSASRLGKGAKVSRREATEWDHAWRRATADMDSDVALSTEGFAPVSELSKRKRRENDEGSSSDSDGDGDGGVGASLGRGGEGGGYVYHNPIQIPQTKQRQQQQQQGNDDNAGEDDGSPAQLAQASAAKSIDLAEVRRLVAQARGEEVDEDTRTRRPRSTNNQPPVVVTFPRPLDLKITRASLPAFGMEQEVMEAISENAAVFVEGATGSGKTTQVPQFLLEAGFGDARNKRFPGCVLVTQPRRVAAVSAASRVAEELGVTLGGSDVGYAVRHEARVQYKSDGTAGMRYGTKLVFVTDGVMLRLLFSDFVLPWVSCVIVDEAHERSVTSDLLLALLTRCVRSRNKSNPGMPLRLVVMSATLDRALLGDGHVDDEEEDGVADDDAGEGAKNEAPGLGQRVVCPPLFPADLVERGTPPVVSIPARRFKVTVHFSRRTSGLAAESDYVDDVIAKTIKLHRRLPPGAMLVFVTGQRDVERVLAALRDEVGAEDPHELLEQSKGNREMAPVQANAAGIGDELGGDDSDEELAESVGKAKKHKHKLKKKSPLKRRNDDADVDDYDEMLAAEEEEEDSDEEDVVVLPGDDDDDADENGDGKGEGVGDDGDEEEAMIAAGKTPARGKPASAAAPPPSRCFAAPLYASLPIERQRAAFDVAQLCESPSLNARAIVVATNVAETSVTVPGVRYVIDCGREKVRTRSSAAPGASSRGARAVLDESLASPSALEVVWCSQASAQQRAGRAGRVCTGHCYRLYSSAVFQRDFPEAKRPLTESEDLSPAVLTLKAIGVGSVSRFPWVTPPHEARILGALRVLASLRALVPSEGRAKGSATTSDRLDELDDARRFSVSELGRSMADLPLAPRVAASLCFALGVAGAGPLARDPRVMKWQAPDVNSASNPAVARKARKAAVGCLGWMLAACAVLSTERATLLNALPAAPKVDDEAGRREDPVAAARAQRKAWASSTRSALLCDACALVAYERAGSAAARRAVCFSLSLDSRACEEARLARRHAVRTLLRTLRGSEDGGGAVSRATRELEKMAVEPPEEDEPSNAACELVRRGLLYGFRDCVASRLTEHRRRELGRAAHAIGEDAELPTGELYESPVAGDGIEGLAALPKGIVGRAVGRAQPESLLFVRLQGGATSSLGEESVASAVHATSDARRRHNRLRLPSLVGATVVEREWLL